MAMPIVTTLFYPTFLVMTFILTLIFIPRKKYKNYFIYGFLIGGLGDVIVVSIMQNLLHVMWFKNHGIFYVLGHIALSPPSWTVTVMLFLYFLPKRRWFLYPYIAAWAGNSIGYAYVVHNAGLYDFVSWLYPIPVYFLFLGWWSFGAWLFMKTSPLANENKILNHVEERPKLNLRRYIVLPKPVRKRVDKVKFIETRKIGSKRTQE